ncbi:UDP-N-acetylmuramoylalanine--D-glutamate ligase [Nitrosomonas sp. Nm51]|uniref:UDP-N-acetylmuramoyl-L-alanine--D-glutamate ligase n=1 Tax=Nitrosomonas sp. Nm51 TaxID=133720 RepID=UPI0008B7E249|nr:UDP-N-acetylmuramoyl-L-alanine--D-glutamate ligase [Nitrosomonas sp. Nm51]SER30955.1 UDP-N-acetylmuramoylalanine--D-glutamate ligase [Nitrosomonas sp. Nm51]
MNLKGKHVLVLGMGETGLSIAKWLARQSASVRVADSRASPPNTAALESLRPKVEICKGAFDDRIFDDIELIAMSPGVPMAEPHIQQAIARGVPVVGDMTLFQWALALGTADYRIIAITGTNGKTTVTAMVGAMLKKAGFDVEVAGNIGPAVLGTLMRRLDSGDLPQVWVLEISSFQLELTAFLNADAATVLNLSEDHLDRYSCMQDYVMAKAGIFKHETHGAGVQVLNRDDVGSMAMAAVEKAQLTFGLNKPETPMDFGLVHSHDDVWLAEGDMLLMKTSDLGVNGMHNAANALAALALCRALQVPADALVSALREFKGLPHRMEKVTVLGDVTFIDDSKSTNVGATVAALNGLQPRVVLIAGGDGKGQDFSPLQDAVARHVRAVVLIGRDADKIAKAIDGGGVPVLFATTMQEAVQKSFLLAQRHDVVLLSPACASYDMFRNYMHRARVFVAAVRALEAKMCGSAEKRR